LPKFFRRSQAKLPIDILLLSPFDSYSPDSHVHPMHLGAAVNLVLSSMQQQCRQEVGFRFPRDSRAGARIAEIVPLCPNTPGSDCLS
jgi:hypothetical protein